MTERQEQAAVFEWAEWAANQQPELALLYAVPNGQVRRGEAVEPGVKPGVPDMCLPVPRNGCHGLYIELKRPGGNGKRAGQVRPEQRKWLDALAGQGYAVAVCRGADAAIGVIERYLDGQGIAQ